MRESWEAVKVPVLGVVAIMALTLGALLLMDSPLLQNTEEPWSITGNVVLDAALYDGEIGTMDRCGQLQDPVCGADGKTYANLCLARKAGVDALFRGACDVWIKE